MSFIVQRSVYFVLALLLIAIAGHLPFGWIALLFVPSPMMLLRMSGDRQVGLIALVLLSSLSFIIVHPLMAMTAIAFLILGWTIGDTTLQRKSKLAVWNTSTIVFLVSLLVHYVISVRLYDFNIVEMIQQFLYNQQSKLTSQLALFDDGGNIEQLIDATILMYQLSLPTSLLTSIVIVSLLSLTFAYMIGKRTVIGFVFPKFPPFSSMKLPMITVVLYGILLVASFLQSTDVGSASHVVLLNAMNIFRLLFLLQGISFIHYVLKTMKMPRILIFFTTIVALFLNSIVVLIGILDTGIQLRAWVDRKAGK